MCHLQYAYNAPENTQRLVLNTAYGRSQTVYAGLMFSHLDIMSVVLSTDSTWALFISRGAVPYRIPAILSMWQIRSKVKEGVHRVQSVLFCLSDFVSAYWERITVSDMLSPGSLTRELRESRTHGHIVHHMCRRGEIRKEGSARRGCENHQKVET